MSGNEGSHDRADPSVGPTHHRCGHARERNSWSARRLRRTPVRPWDCYGGRKHGRRCSWRGRETTAAMRVVAARHLAGAGCEAALVLLCHRNELQGDALEHFQKLVKAVRRGGTPDARSIRRDCRGDAWPGGRRGRFAGDGPKRRGARAVRHRDQGGQWPASAGRGNRYSIGPRQRYARRRGHAACACARTRR